MKNLNTDIFIILTCPSCKTNLSYTLIRKIICQCECKETKIIEGFRFIVQFDNSSVCYLDDSKIEIPYKCIMNKEFIALIRDNFNIKNTDKIILYNKEIYIEQIQWLINTYYKLKINEIFI